MSELTAAKEYLLKAVSAVINSRPIPPMPPEINASLLTQLIFRNSLQAIGYKIFENQEFPYKDKLEKSYRTVTVRQMTQQAECDKIRTDFSNKRIDFMFLKGSHLKKLYPSEELRFMSDIDVIVKSTDINKAQDILVSHGFEKITDNGKDIIYTKKPFLTVELHNSLFVPEYYMYGYFLGVWDRAVKVSDYEYKMTDSDLYVYTMAHLAEHFTMGGACFRPTADIYLMRKKLSDNLDFNYIKKQFAILLIDDFAKQIENVCECMFDGKEKDSSLEITENFIVLGPPVNNSGISGSDGKQHSKFKTLINSLFPKYDIMKRIYPVLEKAKFLIGIFWIIRLIQRMFNPASRKKFEKIKNADKKDIEIMENIYKASGIKTR